MSAIRLARAATGREVVVKFAGAYHGHSDGLLAEAGSGMATLATPGEPRASPRRRPPAPWSCPGTTARRSTRALAEHAVAAVHRRADRRQHGRRPAGRRASSSSCARPPATAGALLIFDEVITGFRVARGGAQELYGVEPDLTVLGKVLGGGLPAAAFAGPRELMERIAPAGDVYQAGTLSGNPLAVAAGLATLRQLDAAAYERLAALTERLARRPRRPRRRTGRCRSPPHPACSPSSSARARSPTSPAPPPATSRPTPASAGRCSIAASTRRPRSSRPGSSPSPTTRRRSTAPSKPPPSRSRRPSERLSSGPTTRSVGSPRRLREAEDADLGPRGRPCERPVFGLLAALGPRRRRPGRVRARGRGGARGLPPPLRRPRACSPVTTPTWPCSPATISTRSASTASPLSATPRRSPCWPI